MASFPPQRTQSQRRASPDESSTSRPDQYTQNLTRTRTRSVTSEDSQTILLNKPTSPTAVQDQSQAQIETSQNHGVALQTANETDDGPKKCWICFSDSTEDTPETSPWRDPCPCALQAHEECLLDWIADVEATNRRSGEGSVRPKILCPQCKSEIELARPRELVVEAFQRLEKLGNRLVIPGSSIVLFRMLYEASAAHGVYSIQSIFSNEDSFRILEPLLYNAIPPEDDSRGIVHEAATRLMDMMYNHWRLYFGLPLITPVLVLSRTKSRFADAILPLLPVFFFATQSYSPDDPLDFGITWPPSAGFAFSVIPYVRSAYNFYFEKVWAARQERWMRELRPRSTQEQEGENQDLNGNPADEENRAADNVLEVRIEGDMWQEWADDEVEQRPPRGGLPPAVAANNDDGQGAPAPDVQDNRPQQQQVGEQARPQEGEQPQHQQNHVQQPERQFSVEPLAIAETVLGALVYPKICEISGELLKLALPLRWTTPSLKGKPTGILQEKWGRSIVGGCLFVVAKDFLMLYVRWRMAQIHRKRKVLDYRRPKARVS